ncbi:hypothetical protein GGTG_00114 [Gaeumannomyces tritici R3-111a-1]|uniref:Uncharacterized protein n=1 Tax=Gaeumannomyces tritici (strain R3-111a-1) TaxID=644352 RepID=J3NFS0_GAET3|nr:hypothetical protein GGTG_00114 [Gaeumannomyces tritici R3-111a-1]EJT80110.1 hypothetical protein GGTG_00114 [Gaeumannomyces tritici R3-111a-1]
MDPQPGSSLPRNSPGPNFSRLSRPSPGRRCVSQVRAGRGRGAVSAGELGRAGTAAWHRWAETPTAKNYTHAHQTHTQHPPPARPDTGIDPWKAQKRLVGQ